MNSVWAAVVVAVSLGLASASAGCTRRVVYESGEIHSGAGGVNVNVASVAELEALPGVGRKTAEAIVEHRTRNGAFRRIEHVMLVQGMSEKRFLEIRNLITN